MKKRRLITTLLALTMAAGMALPAGALDRSADVDRPQVVAAGYGGTVVLGEDGTVYGMGKIQTTDGDGNYIKQSHVPVKLTDNGKAVSYFQPIILKNDNTVWGNGVPSKEIPVGATPVQDLYYIMPDGTVKDRMRFDTGSLCGVELSQLTGVKALAYDEQAAAMIKKDGSLWTWGVNSGMVVGIATEDLHALVKTPVKILDNVIDVERSYYTGAAVQADGSLWTWGSIGGSTYAEYPSHVNQRSYNGIDHYDLPRKVADDVVDVSMGGSHMAVLKADGALWMTGSNTYGQVGCGKNGEDDKFITTPVKVLDNVAAVSCGEYHTVAVKKDGSVWVWGKNDRGQLGLGELGGNKYDSPRNEGIQRYNFQDVPVQVPGLKAKVPAPVKLTPHTASPSNVAFASTQKVDVDGRKVEFQMYALKDNYGNLTNYVKVRDVAHVLNGTTAQFNVGWDQENAAVDLVAGEAYADNGTEMKTPYSGDRLYTPAAAKTMVDGRESWALHPILLTDDAGNGYTYYKLRDLGTALGFTVDWSTDRGVYIETK